MSTVTERVERGAALLDEKRPGWWQRIDLGRLDLAENCDCILGQLDGDYSPSTNGLGLTNPEAAGHGFNATGAPLPADAWDVLSERVDAEYDALTTAWRDLITMRREQAMVPA